MAWPTPLLPRLFLFASLLSAPTLLGQAQFTDFGNRLLPQDSDVTRDTALADVDGDGDLDIVFANSGQQNRLHLNDGRGQFVDGTALRMPTDSANSNAIAIGDVDGDKDLDLVFANFSQQNTLYLNDGNGRFTDATATHLPQLVDRSTDVALGDVDGDGDLDLVIPDAFSSQRRQNHLFLNDGTGRFRDATSSNLPSGAIGAVAVALGDVDGDGDLDIVFGNGGSQNELLLNDGKGRFSDVTATHFPTDVDQTLDIAIGDVDGDRDLDLVLGSFNNQNKLYLNAGNGKFNDATTANLPRYQDATNQVALADIDEDGDLDIIAVNQPFLIFAAQNRLLLNDGKGKFADATSRMARDNSPTASIAIGDVDGDADLDVVTGNLRAQNSLVLNLHRHVYSPTRAVLGRSYQLDFYAMRGYATATQYAAPFVNLVPAVPAMPVPPFGSLGLSLAGLQALQVSNVPAPAGMATIQLTIPNFPALNGKTLYWQVLTIHSVTPLDAGLTNVHASPVTKT